MCSTEKLRIKRSFQIVGNLYLRLIDFKVSIKKLDFPNLIKLKDSKHLNGNT